MAAGDITFTSDDVIAQDVLSFASPTSRGLAQVSIAPGDLVRIVGSDVFLSECDLTAAEAIVSGMSLVEVEPGQLCTFLLPGFKVDIGTNSGSIGVPLTLSNTPGKFGPDSDRVSTEFTTIIGALETATLLDFRVLAFGVGARA